MTDTFSCPTCGAPLKYQGGKDITFPCPYCGNTVIVPENLRAPLSRRFKRQPAPSEKVNEAAIFQKIQDLLKAGKKIEAIKLYRYCYPDGLAAAKNIVDGIEAGTITSLPEKEVDLSILEHGSSESTWKACGWLTLIFVGPVVLILLIVFGLDAIINSSRSKPTTTVHTIPTTRPLATEVPQPTSTPEFATLALRFGGNGTGSGKFQYANDIAIAPDGTIYVGDRDLFRIQVFDATGKFTFRWDLNPDDHYRNLAVDSAGALFVNEGGRIYRYDRQTGKRVGEIKYQDESGFTEGFGSLAPLPNGGLAAAWINETLPTDDILIFDSGGNVVNKIEKAVTGPADWGSEYDIQLAVDGVGNIYALGISAETVVKYSPGGKFLTRFGARGDRPGQFSFESAIAIDSQGRVYMFGNNDIVFDPDGLYIATFEIIGIQYGPIFDLNDSLFISNGVEVMKYTLNPLQ